MEHNKKQHHWVKFYKKGEIIEITLKEASGAKIESWKVGWNDKKRLRQIFRTLKMGYGIVLPTEKDLEKDKDLDWLKE